MSSFCKSINKLFLKFFRYRYVLLDITFVENALALPIFEPLTILCLKQLTSIMTACLRLALFVQSIHHNTPTSTGWFNFKLCVYYFLNIYQIYSVL